MRCDYCYRVFGYGVCLVKWYILFYSDLEDGLLAMLCASVILSNVLARDDMLDDLKRECHCDKAGNV